MYFDEKISCVFSIEASLAFDYILKKKKHFPSLFKLKEIVSLKLSLEF